MLASLALTAWFLASAQGAALPKAPRTALFLAASASEPRSITAGPSAERPPEPDLLRVWMDHLAVVKPHRPDRHAPPTLQMFIAPNTHGGGVGVNAFGRF